MREKSLKKNMYLYTHIHMSFPGGASGKESSCQCRRHKRHGFNPWVGKIPWRTWQSTPVVLPGESYHRGVWWAPVHSVKRSQKQLKRLSMCGCMHTHTHTHTHTKLNHFAIHLKLTQHWKSTQLQNKLKKKNNLNGGHHSELKSTVFI